MMPSDPAQFPVHAVLRSAGPEWIEAHADEWRALAADPLHREPFYQPEWIALHLRMLEPNARVRLAVAWRGERLIGALALVAERGRFARVPLRVLRPATDQVSPDRVDLLARPEDAADAAAAIWSAARVSPGWDLIDLAAVPEDGAANRLLDLAARAGYAVERAPMRCTPVLDLPGPGGTYDDAVAGTDAKFRSGLRRRWRKLDALGELRFVEYREAEPAALAAFFALEAAGWKGREGSAIASNPAERAYYAALAETAACHGYFVLHALELDGRPIAMAYGFLMDGVVYGQKIAYDEAMSAHAPGHAIVQELIRRSVAEGRRRLDFLGQTSPWKREWTDATRRFDRLLLFNRTPAARAALLAHRRLLPLAKRLRGMSDERLGTRD